MRKRVIRVYDSGVDSNGVLAYQRARYPGGHGRVAQPAPTPTPGTPQVPAAE